MKNKRKDQLIDLVVCLFFAAVIAGCAYWFIKIMTTWRVKGLG